MNFSPYWFGTSKGPLHITDFAFRPDLTWQPSQLASQIAQRATLAKVKRFSGWSHSIGVASKPKWFLSVKSDRGADPAVFKEDIQATILTVRFGSILVLIAAM